MKRRRYGATTTVLLGLILLFSILLAGCKLNKTSIEDRVDGFIADLNNGDYASLYKNFHENSKTNSVARSPSFWDGTAFASGNGPFTWSSIAYGDPTSALFTSGGGASNEAASFDMKEEDKDDWYILSLSIPSLGVNLN